ncbi:hypothetical protein LSAT2_017728, partial [Lamellibrachia satsuma]
VVDNPVLNPDLSHRKVSADFPESEMVLRMLVSRCSNYFLPRSAGPAAIRYLYSIFIHSENVGLVRLCRFHSIACTAHCQQFVGAGNVSMRQVRSYAKKGGGGRRDKAKKDGKSGMSLSPEELNEIVNFEKMKNQMDMALEHMKQEYFTQLTIRNTSGAFDNLTVETEDGKFPLIQLGQVLQKGSQLVVINMASSPQYIPAVKMALDKSGMNVNPQQDGTSLFVPVPKVTREHREGLAKNAKVLCDKTKEKLRDIQNRFIRDIKKSKDKHPADLVHGVQETIQSTTHNYVETAEKLMTAKQQELQVSK